MTTDKTTARTRNDKPKDVPLTDKYVQALQAQWDIEEALQLDMQAQCDDHPYCGLDILGLATKP
jgi:hypothetical protein